MNEKRRRTGEEGVALIVVLGFLSLMLVLAVSFLSTAQTERLVSDASLEASRSRQLLKSGLAAAMNDYSRKLWDERLYVPNTNRSVFVSGDAANYYDKSLDFIPGKGGTLEDSECWLDRGEVLDWIPAKYMTNMSGDMSYTKWLSTFSFTNLASQAEWILVREEPGERSRIVGRYAYVCLDSSGGLDGNFLAMKSSVGKTDARALTNRVRRSVRDVPMGLLPELADAGKFKGYRRGWQGFDSLQMLKLLTDGKAVDGSTGHGRWKGDRIESGAGLVSNLVSEVTPYSLSAYRGGRYNRSSGEWSDLFLIRPESGAGWEWATTNNIGNPVPHSEDQLRHIRSHLPSMLKDFTSKSVEPVGTNYPSVKNVPMFNEVIMKHLKLYEPTAVGGGDDEKLYEFKAAVEFQFEFWYPFPGNTNTTTSGKKSPVCDFKAPTLSMASYPDGLKDIGVPVALLVNGKRVMLQESSTTVTSNATVEIESLYNEGNPYTKTVRYETKFKGVKLTEEEAEEGTLMLWCRGWQTQQDINLRHNEKSVDCLPKGLAKGLNVQVAAGKDPDEGSYSMEVCDPRLNHDKDEWQSAEEATPGEINKCTKNNDNFKREGAAMYCRNGPLETPADFGFLSTGESWKTIDLLCDRGVEFLAATTVDTNLYENIRNNGVFYTNAQLNVNTRCSNALASVFYGITTKDVPGWGAKKKEGISEMDEELARKVAELIMEKTASSPYQSGMDWVGNEALMGDRGLLASPPYNFNRNQRESLLRNTYGVFSVADNLFTVVVVAQTVKEGPDNVGRWDDEDQVTGERRGVALVWRDPFKTGNNKHHEMMVKMFSYMFRK